ncbi:MAG: hypothetical protein NUW37_12550 [Planctomycetes bacterium]|nr:hypothetical protein [Planctomycetota bacterium]
MLSLDLQGGTWEIDEANMLAIAPQGDTPALRCEQTGNSLAFVDVPDGIELSGYIMGDSVTLNQHQVLTDEETTSVYDATATLSGIQSKGKTASGTIVIEGTYTGFGYLTYQSGVDQFGNPIIVTDNCTWNGVVTGYIVPSNTVPEEDSLPYDLGVKRIDMAVVSKEADDAMDAEFATLVDELEFVEDKNERAQIGNHSKENVLVIRNDARVGVEEILEEGRDRWRDRQLRGRPDQVDRVAWTGFVQAGVSTLKQIQEAWLTTNQNIQNIVKNPPPNEEPAPGTITDHSGDLTANIGQTAARDPDGEYSAGGQTFEEGGKISINFVVTSAECLPLTVIIVAPKLICITRGGAIQENLRSPNIQVTDGNDRTIIQAPSSLSISFILNRSRIRPCDGQLFFTVDIIVTDNCGSRFKYSKRFPTTKDATSDSPYPIVAETDSLEDRDVGVPIEITHILDPQGQKEDSFKIKISPDIKETDPECQPLRCTTFFEIYAKFLIEGVPSLQGLDTGIGSLGTTNISSDTSVCELETYIKRSAVDLKYKVALINNPTWESAYPEGTDILLEITIKVLVVVTNRCGDMRSFYYVYTP